MPGEVTKGRSVATRFVRVPWRDWSAIVTGEKRMLRLPVRQQSRAFGFTPSPAVAYTMRLQHAQFDSQLMVLEAIKVEPLGVITGEDLALEGYDSLAEFRRYWNARSPRGRGWDPMMKVAAVSVRPWEPDDFTLFSEAIIDRLYGPWRP